MDYKRVWKAILVSIAVMTVITVILSFAFEIELEYTDPANIPNGLWYLAMASATVLSLLVSNYYFNGKLVTPSTSEGFKLGIILVVAGILADILLFSPYEGGLEIFFSYINHYQFWLTNILILLAPVFLGLMKKKPE